MKEYALVKLNTNWADEMDVKGFIVCTTTQWNNLMIKINKVFEYRENVSVYVGTNEELEFASIHELMSCLTIKVIPENEAGILMELFSDDGEFPFTYSHGNVLNKLAKLLDDE